MACVAFEKVMTNELEASSSVRNSSGQLVQNSGLISEHYHSVMIYVHTVKLPFLIFLFSSEKH